MLTSKRLLVCLVSLVLVVSLVGCGEKTGSLTAPQVSQLSIAKPAAPAGQIFDFQALAKTNMYAGSNDDPTQEEGIAAWASDVSVTFGDVKNEFWAYLPKAGDYMIAYHVVDGPNYFVFVAAEEPITLHIGVLKGDYVDAVTIYSGFTYTDADWEAMRYYQEGIKAWFYAPYGIVESDPSISNAIALYAGDPNTVYTTYGW